MKKNNLFMLAYIVFSVLCGVVKIFWDYPMWTTIVGAITTASCIFAISDFLHTQAATYMALAKEQTYHSESALGEITFIRKALLMRIKQVETHYVEKTYTREEELAFCASSQQRIDSLEKDFQRTIKIINKPIKSAKTTLNISTGLTLIGFLSIFCCMTFEPIACFFDQYQEEMTVWAFAIILLTQYLDGWFSEKKEDISKNGKQLTDALDAIRKSIMSEVNHHAD